MKIFKIITTTLCAITLLMAMPSFGMGEKPNKDDKPKKVFGPHLPTKKIPTEKDLQEAKKKLRKSNLSVETLNMLFRDCNYLQLNINLPKILKNMDTLLSQYGADPNSLGININDPHLQERPLHIAVRNPRAWEAVELLLNWKADPNKLDSYKRTPLHVATLHGNGLAVELLLKAGARIQIKDEDGRTPLYYIPHDKRLTALAYYNHGVVPTFLNTTATTEEEENKPQNLAFKMLYALNKYLPAQKEYQDEREQVRKQVAEHLPLPTPLVTEVTDYISSKELLSTEDWSKTRAWPLVTLEPSPSTEKRTLDENKDDETESEHQAAPTYLRDEDNPSSLKYIPRKSNNQ